MIVTLPSPTPAVQSSSPTSGRSERAAPREDFGSTLDRATRDERGPTTDRTGDRATDRATDRAGDRVADRAVDRATDRRDDRVADRAADRATDRVVAGPSDTEGAGTPPTDPTASTPAAASASSPLTLAQVLQAAAAALGFGRAASQAAPDATVDAATAAATDADPSADPSGDLKAPIVPATVPGDPVAPAAGPDPALAAAAALAGQAVASTVVPVADGSAQPDQPLAAGGVAPTGAPAVATGAVGPGATDPATPAAAPSSTDGAPYQPSTGAEAVAQATSTTTPSPTATPATATPATTTPAPTTAPSTTAATPTAATDPADPSVAPAGDGVDVPADARVAPPLASATHVPSGTPDAPAGVGALAPASGSAATAPTGAATPAPAAPAPAAPAEPRALAEQLGVRLSALRSAGPGEHLLTLRVEPDSIGPIRVLAHIGTEGVRIELLGGTDQARDALRAALPDLRRDLAAAGLGADLNLGADLRGQDPGGRDGQHRPRPAPTSAAPAAGQGTTSTVPTGRPGGLDLLV